MRLTGEQAADDGQSVSRRWQLRWQHCPCIGNAVSLFYLLLACWSSHRLPLLLLLLLPRD
jgi:hypothetical protein